ncbi:MULTISPECIES: hypothetical protein [Alteromonadaceae]|uniref:hypothetical protein n=1 Tax=Alteromonadaceae TaxID=72275 RepID=UPI001C090E2E|nr:MULTISPECIES: hypothetical protein [Aliiglaciecola]MBU2878069.1 hypothetical protein [Aliiglaciecola lipolytica]MDO6709434.1 hypothetical protein [Aliiglaciecola sp. 2_MG-2023]MDO6750582.1 hypothetical protein [Aliiglaciecola sp. 1_MG-2023]
MKPYLILILLTLFSCAHKASAEAIIVVANTADKSIQLNRQQIRNLFMGGAIPYDLHAIALSPDNETRLIFNTKVIGLTESRIQSFWAQMRFTGRKKEPKEVGSEAELLEYLKNNEGSLGYFGTDVDIPSELTVILTIN